MLFEDCRRNENEKIALGACIQMFLEEIAEDRDITHDRYFRPPLANFVLQQPADGEGVTASDEHVGIKRSGVDDWAGHSRASKNESSVSNLVTDLGLHTQSDEVIFVN